MVSPIVVAYMASFCVREDLEAGILVKIQMRFM